jgi:adenylate cyclase class 2
VRSIGNENRITYKGPRKPGPTKTREEIEIPFAAGADAADQMLRLFDRLGFKPVATIRKQRESFQVTRAGQQVEIALDCTELLGDFAEIETFSSSEAGLSAAQSAVLALAAELGLSEVEPRSYLRMALERAE